MSENELFNRQAEQLVLSGLLQHPEDYYSINDVSLVPSDFGSREARNMLRAIVSVADEKRTPTTANVIEALRAADPAATTDEASAIEQLGHRPHLVMGSAANLKVTYPEDLELARLLLQTERQ